jgi:hypothetical protein
MHIKSDHNNNITLFDQSKGFSDESRDGRNSYVVTGPLIALEEQRHVRRLWEISWRRARWAPAWQKAEHHRKKGKHERCARPFLLALGSHSLEIIEME